MTNNIVEASKKLIKAFTARCEYLEAHKKDSASKDYMLALERHWTNLNVAKAKAEYEELTKK